METVQIVVPHVVGVDRTVESAMLVSRLLDRLHFEITDLQDGNIPVEWNVALGCADRLLQGVDKNVLALYSPRFRCGEDLGAQLLLMMRNLSHGIVSHPDPRVL